MTEEEAINRLAACKDLFELIEANLQEVGILPLEGATNDQLDNLERLGEVDPGMYSKARPKKKAGFNAEQVALLYRQMPFVEQGRFKEILCAIKNRIIMSWGNLSAKTSLVQPGGNTPRFV